MKKMKKQIKEKTENIEVVKKKSKKLLVIIICVVLAAIIGVSVFAYIKRRNENYLKQGIVATVNGEKIYQKEIDESVRYQETAKKVFEEMGGTDQTVAEVSSEKETLESLIRRKIILQQAKRNGCLVSLENSRQSIKEALEERKNSDDKNYDYILKLYTELGMTEDEYLDYSAKLQQVTDSYNDLLHLFKWKKYSDISSKEAEAKLEKDLERRVHGIGVHRYK